MLLTMTRNWALGSLLLFCSTALPANWPSWRGPNQNGTSPEKNLPVKWSTEENVTWKLAMPDVSGSSPVIWGEHLFLHVADSGSLYLWNIDRNNGQARWKRKIADNDYKVRKGNMSSPSPVTDGRTVWVMTGNGAVKAFDFTGKELWARDFWKDYGKFGLNHGYGSSPLLHRGALYIQVLHGMHTDDPSYVVKLDGASGKTLWRVERPTDAIRESPDSYTTPTLVTSGGAEQLVITGGDYVTGHDLETGKELWRGAGLNPRNNPANRMVSSALVHGEYIVVPTRVNPMQVFRAGGSGDISKSHLVWDTPNGPDVPTPVTDGKLLYMINDRGIAWCFDLATGKEVYGGQRIPPAVYSSSPVLADGKIYMSNEEGQTIVLKAGPTFEVLAENTLNDYHLGTLAISDGQIFMRTRSFLYCIGKRAAAR
jgi:outer membrane protein assembly factor BamB